MALKKQRFISPKVAEYPPGHWSNCVRVGDMIWLSGFTARANQRDIDVTRKINGEVMTGRVTISNPLLAGDTIYVRERFF